MARGSIVERRRANGVTAFAIKYRTGDGTQVFTTIGTDRRAAERALTAALAAVDRGDLNGVTRETLGGYAERWLADHRGRVEHATAIDYENSLRNHVLPVLGAIRLSAIRPEHLRAYAAGKRDGSAAIAHQPNGKGGRIKRVLAPKTINNHLTLISLILGHAVADGLLSAEPGLRPRLQAPDQAQGAAPRAGLPPAERSADLSRRLFAVLANPCVDAHLDGLPDWRVAGARA